VGERFRRVGATGGHGEAGKQRAAPM
jgi:hypothetical protein